MIKFEAVLVLFEFASYWAIFVFVFVFAFVFAFVL